MTTKRQPFWQLPGTIKNLPNGSKIREESIGADTVLLHVTFPQNTFENDYSRIDKFAKSFSNTLPKNTRAVFTEEGIKINVTRPRSVSLTMTDNTIHSRVLIEQIEELVKDKSIHQVNIFITNNEILEDASATPRKKVIPKRKPIRKRREK